MRTAQKITRAIAIYGVVFDEKTLINLLSDGVDFSKFLLEDPENNLRDWIDKCFGQVRDDRLKWTTGEVYEGTEIFIFGRDLTTMRNDETFGEFVESTKSSISKLIKCDFACSIISVPEGTYWS